MGVQKSFLLLQIVFVLLAAIVIMMLAIHLASVKEVDHLPEEKVDELRLQKMETIRLDILTRLGLTEPLGSSEPLTEDQEAIVAAFRDYQTAEEARRTHAKGDNSASKYTIVGQLHKQGRVQAISGNEVAITAHLANDLLCDSSKNLDCALINKLLVKLANQWTINPAWDSMLLDPPKCFCILCSVALLVDKNLMILKFSYS